MKYTMESNAFGTENIFGIIVVCKKNYIYFNHSITWAIVSPSFLNTAKDVRNFV